MIMYIERCRLPCSRFGLNGIETPLGQEVAGIAYCASARLPAAYLTPFQMAAIISVHARNYVMLSNLFALRHKHRARRWGLQSCTGVEFVRLLIRPKDFRME